MLSVSGTVLPSASRLLAWVSQKSPATAAAAPLMAPKVMSLTSSCSSSSPSSLFTAPRMFTVAHRVSTMQYRASPVCCAPSDVMEDLAKDLHEIIHHDRLVVFLTGTPQQPRCRFTAQLVDLLNQLGVKYSFFNIIDDDEVCEGLKAYSDWPTYPQVYVDGELLGGYDICKEMMLNGTLTSMLKEKNLM